MGATLRDYQQPHFSKLLHSLIANSVAHDGSDMGTGKTFVGAALTKAFDEDTLLVVPKSVVPSWREALEAFGTTKYTLINYESAWRKLGEVKPWGTGSFFRWHKRYDNVIFDEAHRIGGDTTINSKMAIAAKRQCGRILTLSATIAENPIRMKAFGYIMGLHDLNDWMNFLLKCNCKPGTFGGWTFAAAKNQMIMVGLHEEIYGSPGVLGKGSRMRIDDIPGFPSTVLDVRLLPCVDKQVLRLSEELKGHYTERTIRAHETESELARMTFMRQALETAKVPAIGDMIEDALESSRVAVFCNFIHTVQELVALATKRKWTYGVIQGGQTEEERFAVIKSFQRNELDCVFCNIDAGGVGVSLHDPVTKVPRTSIICPTFSVTSLKQATGRVRRDGGGFSRQFLVYFEQSLEAQIARAVRTKLNSLHLLNDAELCGDFRRAA